MQNGIPYTCTPAIGVDELKPATPKIMDRRAGPSPTASPKSQRNTVLDSTLLRPGPGPSASALALALPPYMHAIATPKV